MTDGQGKNSIATTFSKQGYKYIGYCQKLHNYVQILFVKVKSGLWQVISVSKG